MKRNDRIGGPGPVGWHVPLMRRTLVAALCLCVCGYGSPLAAEPDFDTDEPDFSAAEEVGVGVASVLLTIPYSAGKILYAGAGGVIGGFTWVLSGGDMDAAESVWEPSLNGTYVITPEHLRGKEPIRFFGQSPYQDDRLAE